MAGGLHVDSRGAFFRDASGAMQVVPRESIQAAVDQGWAPVSTDELAAEDHRRELASTGATIEAGLLGALRGATLGLSDVVAGAYGGAERAAELRAAHPQVSTATEVAGGVAGALIPGGAVARVGRAAESIGGIVARGAAEGALMGAGEGVSEVALSSEPRSIAGTIAARGIEGAAGGAIMGLGILGVGKAARMAGRGIERLSEIGKKPTKLAEAATRLEAIQGQQLLSDPLARRAQLRTELDSQHKIAAQLRRDDPGSALLGDLEIRSKAIAQEIGAIDKEILAIDRTVGGRTRVTSQTRRSVDRIRAGQEPASEDVISALREQHTASLAQYDDVNVAIHELRTNIRRRLRLDDPVTEQMRVARQYLEEQRSIIGRRNDALLRDIDVAREGIAERQGRQWIETTRVIERIPDVEAAARKALDRSGVIERTSVSIPQEMIDKLKAQRTGGDLAQFFAWRSASTLLGFALGDMPGAIIGSIAGARGGAGIQRAIEGLMPTLSAAAPFARAMGRGAVTAARVGPVRATLSALESDALARELSSPASDPERIYAASYAGYSRSGMRPTEAQGLASLQAQRAAVMRQAIPTDHRDPGQRRLFGEVRLAASDPTSIAQRIRARQETTGDMMVLDAIAPGAASEVRALGLRLLSADPRMGAADRRHAEMLAYGRSVSGQRVAAMLRSASESDRAGSSQARPGSLGDEATPSQRISA